MLELGGHCLATVLEAFEQAAASETPKFIIAYTIKGRRLPFQGHKDNHSGLMNPAQIEDLRDKLGIPQGDEWARLAGLTPARREMAETVLSAAPRGTQFLAPQAETVAIPALDVFPDPGSKTQSTQVAFGKILNDLAREETDFVSRIVTTSPDVTVSTNLGGFVNRKGLFSRSAHIDVFKKRKIASPQIWAHTPEGQHIELGIAENNLFLMLAALGLSADHFGERLFPIGTVYDPFIARGLDALNYACYQDARFILVATPSGLTLAPEGGAHQSITSPVIGMGQPGLAYYEPAFADEVRICLHEAFNAVQREGGHSTYLRLSTRPLPQPERSMDAALRQAVLAGAYWAERPGQACELAICYCGAMEPEARSAWEALREDGIDAGLLAVTSPDVLHRDWTRSTRASWTGEGAPHAYAEGLLGAMPSGAGLVTLIDGAPSTLSWLGAVDGRRTIALGPEDFGQTGDLPDLYGKYRMDMSALLDACASLLAS